MPISLYMSQPLQQDSNYYERTELFLSVIASQLMLALVFFGGSRGDCFELFFFISFIRSYSNPFYLLFNTPLSLIQYQKKKSSQLILRKCSLVNILLKIFQVSKETGLMLRGSLSSKLFMCFMRSDKLPCPKGGVPNSISQNTTPRDQMSALLLYRSPFRISGAMQTGDPSTVCVKSSSVPIFLQNPKSASLSFPSFIKMLSGLMSLWYMEWSDSTLKALISCLINNRLWVSDRYLYFLMYASRVPPSQYQQTMQMLFEVLIIQRNLTMWGLCQTSFKVSTSFLIPSVSFDISWNLDMGIDLMATSALVSMCVALQTFPYCPCPIALVSVQFPTILTIRLNKFDCQQLPGQILIQWFN